MFIPIRTDRPARRRPIVTEGLIVVNMLVYLAGLIGQAAGAFTMARFVDFGHFDPQNFKAWQLITSMFMHDPYGIGHLAFNMLFLWVFGAPVEDRMGRISFLGFYLIGGVVAAIAHMMVSDAPVIGASGAIAGVTGAFLALFPRSRIIVLVFFFFIGVYAVPSLWFIGLYFTIDVLNQTTELLGGSAGDVAYMAHIAGYVYGFTLAFVLLATKLVSREEYDVFFLFTQARRRAAFRTANRYQAGGMWDSASADTSQQLARLRKQAPPPTEQEQRIAEARAEVNRLLNEHRLAEAAEKYRALLQEAPDTVLSEPRQLDVANQLLAQGDHAHAAAAYELLLDRYPGCHRAAEVRLLLGSIYARQLRRPERAREVISAARPSLHDAGQIALADTLMAELAR